MFLLLFDLILTIAWLYMAYSHQQMNMILNFMSMLLLLFLSFFSMNDIYLMSWFVALMYSGAIVVSFIFVMMMLDVCNLRVTALLNSFALFINQQL